MEYEWIEMAKNVKKGQKRIKRLMDGGKPVDKKDCQDLRSKPIQGQVQLESRDHAIEITFPIPDHWYKLITKMAKKCRCDPAFLYRKAFQAFFDLPPAIFDDDGYLKQWREVFELEGETALRPHIQECDDDMTRRILRARDRERKRKFP